MKLLEKMMLTGKKAVVTGGAQAIGLAVVKGLAELGADVAVLDVAEAPEAMGYIRDAGRTGIYIKTDVRRPEQIDAAFEQVMQEFGRLDILFNNAGIFEVKMNAEDMTFEEWRSVMDVNLDGMFLVAQRAGRIMIPQKSGSIVNTASMSASIVNIPQKQIAYNTAKAGVVHMTRTLAVEWGKHKIRVNCLSPGYIATQRFRPDALPEDIQKLRYTLTPLERMGTPEEVAGAACYLFSDAASFTTGHDLVVDGGYVCV